MSGCGRTYTRNALGLKRILNFSLAHVGFLERIFFSWSQIFSDWRHVLDIYLSTWNLASVISITFTSVLHFDRTSRWSGFRYHTPARYLPHATKIIFWGVCVYIYKKISSDHFSILKPWILSFRTSEFLSFWFFEIFKFSNSEFFFLNIDLSSNFQVLNFG